MTLARLMQIGNDARISELARIEAEAETRNVYWHRELTHECDGVARNVIQAMVSAIELEAVVPVRAVIRAEALERMPCDIGPGSDL